MPARFSRAVSQNHAGACWPDANVAKRRDAILADVRKKRKPLNDTFARVLKARKRDERRGYEHRERTLMLRIPHSRRAYASILSQENFHRADKSPRRSAGRCN